MVPAFSRSWTDGQPMLVTGRSSCFSRLLHARRAKRGPRAPPHRREVPWWELAMASQPSHGGRPATSGAIKGLACFRSAGARHAALAYVGTRPGGLATRLAALYPYPAASRRGRSCEAVCLLAAATLLVLRAAPRHPYLPLGWLWYVVTLVARPGPRPGGKPVLGGPLHLRPRHRPLHRGGLGKRGSPGRNGGIGIWSWRRLRASFSRVRVAARRQAVLAQTASPSGSMPWTWTTATIARRATSLTRWRAAKARGGGRPLPRGAAHPARLREAHNNLGLVLATRVR